MATVLGSLLVKLGLDLSEFRSGLTASEKDLKRATRAIERTGKDMVNFGAKMSLAVTVPLIALGKASIAAAAESRDAIAQVEASLASMGSAAGRSSEQLQALADGEMRRSLYDDDEILRSVTANLLTFGDIAGEQFDRAQSAAIDLAAKLKTDLQSATLLVGKALNNPVKGLTALSRAGIQFTDQQKAQIKAMIAVGDAAGAQKIMLAELERQFGGSAEAARKADPFGAMKQSWAEFQEKVGEQLLKAMPAITGAIERLFNAFNSLSPGMQQTVVIGLAVTAALGPLLMVVGSLVTIFAPLIALLTASGAAGAVAGAGGAAATTGFAGLGVALAPLLPWLAGFAAAGLLIYANWDSVAPALRGLGEAFGLLESKVAAATTALATEVKIPLLDALEKLGASKDKLAEVSGLLDKLKAGTASADEITVIEQLIQDAQRAGTIAPAEIVKIEDAVYKLKTAQEEAKKSDPWKEIGESIVSFSDQAQAALDAFDKYNADAAARNRAKWENYGTILTGVGRAYFKLADDAGKWMAALYTGVKTWVQDKLNAVWAWLSGKIEAAKKAFFGLYDAVVGHSYIPDMVDGIAAHMKRLDAEMVKPVERATKKAADAFKKLRDDLLPLMRELFPEAAQLAEFDGKRKQLTDALAALAKGKDVGFTKAQLEAALARLDSDSDNPNNLAQHLLPKIAAQMPRIDAEWNKLTNAANDNARGIQAANVRVVKSFKDMADETLGALQRLTSAVQGGGFLGILEAVIGLGLQLGSIGVFGSGIQGRLSGSAVTPTKSKGAKIPGFANGTRFAPGGLALVGERGPELVKLPTGSQVFPNGTGPSSGGGNVYHIQGNVLTPEFFAWIKSGNAAAAAAGAQGGENRVMFRGQRSVG